MPPPRSLPAISPNEPGFDPNRSSSASRTPGSDSASPLFFVRETREHARHEAANHIPAGDTHHHGLTTREVFRLTSFRDKALSSCSQAGLVNNLNDGLAWGLFPILFADAGLSIGRIGVLAAMYPAVWGLGQLYTGGLSDRIGRKPLIVVGMLTQALAIALIAATGSFATWAVGAIVLGAGTAMVYPTLLAAIGDVAHPSWRARSVGVYRLWRDGGFAIGALLAGILADLISIPASIYAVAALTAASGLVVAIRMYETHPRSNAPTVPSVLSGAAEVDRFDIHDSCVVQVSVRIGLAPTAEGPVRRARPRRPTRRPTQGSARGWVS